MPNSNTYKQKAKFTFLSSDNGIKGCFVAAAPVGDIELKLRRFLSASPVLPIILHQKTPHSKALEILLIPPHLNNHSTVQIHENPNKPQT